jgi:hypothetical protein
MPNLPARGQKAKAVTAKKKNVTLPTLLSGSTTSTPMAQSSVRHSSRRSSQEGYFMVRLQNAPFKKRKAEVVMIDEATGQTSPVPILVL